MRSTIKIFGHVTHEHIHSLHSGNEICFGHLCDLKQKICFILFKRERERERESRFKMSIPSFLLRQVYFWKLIKNTEHKLSRIQIEFKRIYWIIAKMNREHKQLNSSHNSKRSGGFWNHWLKIEQIASQYNKQIHWSNGVWYTALSGRLIVCKRSNRKWNVIHLNLNVDHTIRSV